MAAATAKVGGNSAEATSRFTAGGGQKGKWANHFSREEVGNFLDLKNGFVLADMNHVLYFAPYNIQSSRVDEIYNVRIPSEAPGLEFDFGLNPYN